MATQPIAKERRRCERVLIRVPLLLQSAVQGGVPQEHEAEAVVVSRFGALLRAKAALAPGSIVQLTHGFTHEVEQFRVIWSGANKAQGHHDIGVEQVVRREDFWGIRFPPR